MKASQSAPDAAGSPRPHTIADSADDSSTRALDPRGRTECGGAARPADDSMAADTTTAADYCSEADADAVAERLRQLGYI